MVLSLLDISRWSEWHIIPENLMYAYRFAECGPYKIEKDKNKEKFDKVISALEGYIIITNAYKDVHYYLPSHIYEIEDVLKGWNLYIEIFSFALEPIYT